MKLYKVKMALETVAYARSPEEALKIVERNETQVFFR